MQADAEEMSSKPLSQCTLISSARPPWIQPRFLRSCAEHFRAQSSVSFVCLHQGHSGHNFQFAGSKSVSLHTSSSRKFPRLPAALQHSCVVSSAPGPGWTGWTGLYLGEMRRAGLPREGQQAVKGFLSGTRGLQDHVNTPSAQEGKNRRSPPTTPTQSPAGRLSSQSESLCSWNDLLRKNRETLQRMSPLNVPKKEKFEEKTSKEV
ncbi:hypothetical protein HJG60_009128 [Phyllostomus discolor]|uniref:Uncharacterized protein n=1 Tax=Phyllostomus discolor TaxID=89673 RepID=A0A833YM47_9CHIR|nr:hypothetical protein HJG60_009128 [Phyllostomus discolor]